MISSELDPAISFAVSSISKLVATSFSKQIPRKYSVIVPRSLLPSAFAVWLIADLENSKERSIFNICSSNVV
jgi:hypothetical protein